MLRMGKLTDYGIVLMSHMADNPAAQFSAQALAEAVKVPVPTVRKVLKALCQSGLLASERGAQGGYSLTRAAEMVSIAEVITAIEGPIALTECVSTESQCDQATHCDVQTNWDRINRAVYHALDEVKLSDMLISRSQADAVTPIHFYPSVAKQQDVIQQDGEIHG